MRRAASLLLAIGAAAPLAAGNAVYVIGGATPVSRSVNGYVQEAVETAPGLWRVHVVTQPAPLRVPGWKPAAGVVDPGTRHVPAGFRVPPALEGLAAAECDPFERAARILRWARERIRLVEDERRPQDAASVLARRTARCSGLANASVALLRAAGFPARPVSGILVTPDGPVPHRWLEVYLDGAGWVPGDPTLGLWVITARHVACAAPAVGRLSVTARTLEDGDIAVLPVIGGVRSRPVDGAELLVRVVGDGSGTDGRVVLSGPGGLRREARAPGEIRFAALLPGRWRLRLEYGGKVVRTVSLRLASGDARSLVLPCPRMEASS